MTCALDAATRVESNAIRASGAASDAQGPRPTVFAPSWALERELLPPSVPSRLVCGAAVLCSGAAVLSRTRTRQRRTRSAASFASLTQALPAPAPTAAEHVRPSVRVRGRPRAAPSLTRRCLLCRAGRCCDARGAGALHVDAAAHAGGAVPGAAQQAAAARRARACACTAACVRSSPCVAHAARLLGAGHDPHAPVSMPRVRHTLCGPRAVRPPAAARCSCAHD